MLLISSPNIKMNQTFKDIYILFIRHRLRIFKYSNYNEPQNWWLPEDISNIIQKYNCSETTYHYNDHNEPYL